MIKDSNTPRNLWQIENLKKCEKEGFFSNLKIASCVALGRVTSTATVRNQLASSHGAHWHHF